MTDLVSVFFCAPAAAHHNAPLRIMKKFDVKSNAYGKIIEKYRKSKNMSRADVSRELDLIDVPINPDELYRIERQNMILKDYELIAICMILDIDYNDLIKVIKKKK